jgi:hypothetical protein
MKRPTVESSATSLKLEGKVKLLIFEKRSIRPPATINLTLAKNIGGIS